MKLSYLGHGNCYFCKFFHFKELKTPVHVPFAQEVLMLFGLRAQVAQHLQTSTMTELHVTKKGARWNHQCFLSEQSLENFVCSQG